MINIQHKMNIGVVSIFCAVLVMWSVTICMPKALAQGYPIKPIRIVVASTAGSGTDIVARLFGDSLTEALKQQVIIENRPGAGGRIGHEMVAKSAPDGYTLLLINAVTVIDEAMFKDLPYNLVKDFSPITLMGKSLFILAANPSVPVTSVKELVTLAKSKPGVLKYGSGGHGSTAHLAAEVLKFRTGIDMKHVSYKGVTPAMIGAMSGEVDVTFQGIATCLPNIKSGKLKALGVSSIKRSPLVPDLPAIAEFVPDFEFIGWYGLVAPTKTPPAIISKLNAELIKALNNSAVRKRMADLGVEPYGNSEQEFALYIDEQLQKMKEAVKLAGVSSTN